MIGIFIIVGSYVISLSSIATYFTLYERKKKKLGFVNVGKSSAFNMYFNNLSIKSALIFWLLTICLIANLIFAIPLFCFKKCSDDDLSAEYNSGEITTVDKARKQLETSDKKLALRVLKVRKIQMKYEASQAKKRSERDGIIEEIESTYRDITLPEKVVAVRSLKNKSGMANRVIPFSEYGIDKKIALLLSELEIAYQEKAKIEGTDLEKEAALLLENKELKK